MINVSDLLRACGYITQKQQIAFIQLLVICRAFDSLSRDQYCGSTGTPVVPTSRGLSTGSSNLTLCLDLWMPRINHGKSAEGSYRNRIDRENASAEILKTLQSDLFFNFQDALHWLVTVLNEQLLLKDFHTNTAHLQKIYSEQLRKLPSHLEQHKKTLSKVLKTLGMLQGNAWPSQEEIGHVVLLGEMEDVVRTRLQFMGDFQGKLYYLTNPRGLFNHEPSLAVILASWFEL